MVDVLITGGTILDGTGNPGFRGAVAVTGERLRVLRGTAELPEAERTIDATGLVVAPGFIDMHSHSGLMIFDDPRHLPKLSQGVTTELIGIDGNSYAPFRERQDLEAFARMYAGLDGGPDLDYDWDSVASYLSRFDGAVSVNIAFLIGNSALRICAVGWDPTEAGRDAVADPRIRQEVRSEMEASGELDAWLRQFDHVRVGNFRLPAHSGYEGRRVSEIAREREQDALETVCDLLVAEELRVNEVAQGPNGTTLPRFIEHHLGMVGTDSIFIGARPSPRTWGGFPRILGDFVREEALLSLPDAIRKMTSYPAQRLGLADRGLLRDGLYADVTVFDPARVRALATYDQPVRQSEGIEYVLVNGTVVIDGGRHTGALPGRGLRRRPPGS